MILKWYRLIIIGTALVLTTSCTEFALLMSGSSIAISQNAYVKAYNGIDVLTIMRTEKSIKKHIYDELRKQKKSKYQVLFKGKE